MQKIKQLKVSTKTILDLWFLLKKKVIDVDFIFA